jgi:hypothetical protein
VAAGNRIGPYRYLSLPLSEMRFRARREPGQPTAASSLPNRRIMVYYLEFKLLTVVRREIVLRDRRGL